MISVSLKAHYDGEHIVLDEPRELVPNARLLVLVLPEAEGKIEPPNGRPVPPKLDFAAQLKAIYGDFVLSDEAFDEILDHSKGSIEDYLR